jgi:hypothetical protein
VVGAACDARRSSGPADHAGMVAADRGWYECKLAFDSSAAQLSAARGAQPSANARPPTPPPHPAAQPAGAPRGQARRPVPASRAPALERPASAPPPRSTAGQLAGQPTPTTPTRGALSRLQYQAPCRGGRVE